MPAQDAFAKRDQHRGQAHQKMKAKQAETMSPVAGLNLSGSYTLVSVNGRVVRDVELSKTKVNFLPDRGASFDTACNTLGSVLRSRASPGRIVSFEVGAQTVKACQPRPTQAEAATNRIMRETANIARAGDTITFFNAQGQNIAQWMRVIDAVGTSALPPPRPVTQTVPSNAIQARPLAGDYRLTHIGDDAVISRRQPPPPPPPPNAAPTSMAPPLKNQPHEILVSTFPTLYLRANGRVSGSSGCNTYETSLLETITPPTPPVRRFGPVTTTKRACLDTRAGNLEARFFDALRTASTVNITIQNVDLIGRNGAVLAKLQAISGPLHPSTNATPATKASESPSLYGTNWALRSFNGTYIDGTRPPSIIISARQATGSTGCNRFEVQHRRENNISRFSGGMMTEMACMDNGRNVLERRFMDAILASTSLEINNNKLTMRAPTSRNILIFEAE